MEVYVDRFVSGAELGRLLGISRQAIHKARKDGRLEPSDYDERGWPLYDLDTAKQTLFVDPAQQLRFVHGGRPTKQANVSSSPNAPTKHTLTEAEKLARIAELRQLEERLQPFADRHLNAFCERVFLEFESDFSGLEFDDFLEPKC